jgi:flavin reductase (DIM6/NTAB) family NADH-FMN oxidoreductase RutF
MPIGENHMMLLIGHVRRVHVRRDVLAEGEKLVDVTKLMAVSRLGGSTYSLTGTRFDIARPAWKNEADAVNASIEQKKSKT